MKTAWRQWLRSQQPTFIFSGFLIIGFSFYVLSNWLAVLFFTTALVLAGLIYHDDQKAFWLSQYQLWDDLEWDLWLAGCDEDIVNNTNL